MYLKKVEEGILLSSPQNYLQVGAKCMVRYCILICRYWVTFLECGGGMMVNVAQVLDVVLALDVGYRSAADDAACLPTATLQ